MSLTTQGYGTGMTSAGLSSRATDGGESLHRPDVAAELARGNRTLAAVGPVLRHLVTNDDNAMFGEEPIARTRGMIESFAQAIGRHLGEGVFRDHGRAIVNALIDQPALLAHCHAMALEGQLTERLALRGVDPVLPPLVHRRMASTDAETAALAMSLMAAQTRFVRQQQRMELILAELPGDLLHQALVGVAGALGPDLHARIAMLRDGFDEARGRLALLAQVGLSLGDDFAASLDPDQAGFALFATALSLMTGHDRDAIVRAAADGQQVRLALLLAVAGVNPDDREAVLAGLFPDAPVAGSLLGLDAHHAADLLAGGLLG